MAGSRKVVSGDTLSQDIVAPRDGEGAVYAASDGWTMTYRLIPRSASNSVIQVDCVADGDDYTLAVTAADTATWGAGYYGVSAYVTKGTETYTVIPAFTQIEVVTNPRLATAGTDTRTQAEKALDDAVQALADAQARAANAGTSGSASGALIEYWIGERKFKYATAQEAVESMIKAVGYWKTEVGREKNAAALQQGLASPRQVYVRAARA